MLYKYLLWKGKNRQIKAGCWPSPVLPVLLTVLEGLSSLPAAVFPLVSHMSSVPLVKSFLTSLPGGLSVLSISLTQHLPQ